MNDLGDVELVLFGNLFCVGSSAGHNLIVQGETNNWSRSHLSADRKLANVDGGIRRLPPVCQVLGNLDQPDTTICIGQIKVFVGNFFLLS